MSTQITWQVQWMRCYPQFEGETDVVFQVGWSCFGLYQAPENVQFRAAQSGQVSLTLDSSSPFTPYADLTQDQVLGWVWGAGVNQSATEARVQAQIDEQVNPTVVEPPLPWLTPTPAA